MHNAELVGDLDRLIGMESPKKDALDAVTMVWKDLYGDAACKEARSREKKAELRPSSFWQALVRTLCE